MNKTLSQIQPSATLAITSRAKQLRAKGFSVCNFAAGEPDFDTPETIKQSAIGAIKAGKTKYTPSTGIAELCQAVSAKFKNDNGLDYAPSQIIVSCGAKHSLSIAFFAICNYGDEVIIPSPAWLSYPEMVRIAGGVPVFIHGAESNGLKITPRQLEAAITPKTVAMIMNSPSNPTGIVYTAEEMKELADICVKHNIYIIADEIYERMVYDGTKHTSIGSLSPEILSKTITINGFSKAYSMTGWRVGYTGAPADVIRAMCTVQSHTASPSATFAQYAAVTAMLNCDADIKTMVAAFAQRRLRMFELLSAIPGMTCVKPMGAFYMFPNISSFGLTSKEFAERLIDEKHVAVVPGTAFGADSNIRLSYACGMDEIEEGVSRIASFCKSL